MNCKSCQKTWNRDRNAATNIGIVFDSYRFNDGQRPAYLQRSRGDGSNNNNKKKKSRQVRLPPQKRRRTSLFD
jgi:hypothetical protein